MSREKQSTAVLQTRKRRRRQWLTFVRMIRYGINNFSRNAWLTIAATAVMTITLLIFFLTVAAQNILRDSVDAISSKVDMSIYLKTGTTAEQASPIMEDLRKLSNVRNVSFISSEQARDNNAQNSKDDNDILDAINEASNELPATIRVNLDDINDTAQLDDFVKNNENVKEHIDGSRLPSFSGDRREAIKRIAGWTVTAQKIGLTASIVFVAVSSLIIFNTIRMAIFSRKEEIQMMKLIGADRSFIRGPFIVEAVVYGFLAALLATGLGYGILKLVQSKMADTGLIVQPTLDATIVYLGFVLLGMIVLGGIIGVISSLLATRRYLRV